jgi:Na+/glutamate symporter
MTNKFWTRFVIVVFAGAAAGLLVGVIGKYAFDAQWNIFAAMAWGIMAGSIGLSFGYATNVAWRKEFEKN